MLCGSCYKLGCDFSLDPMGVTSHPPQNGNYLKALGSRRSVTAPPQPLQILGRGLFPKR